LVSYYCYRLVINPDHRITLDHIVEVDDNGLPRTIKYIDAMEFYHKIMENNSELYQKLRQAIIKL
jgi:hypothetical protein